MTTADNHSYNRLSCQIGDIAVLTRTTLDTTQIANSAKKELGAFLFAVKEVFGSDNAKAFRRITIQTSADLADAFTLQTFLQDRSEVSKQHQSVQGAK
jgi:hypothetical protein